MMESMVGRALLMLVLLETPDSFDKTAPGSYLIIEPHNGLERLSDWARGCNAGCILARRDVVWCPLDPWAGPWRDKDTPKRRSAQT